jgi:hypothetical protein
MFAAFGLMPAVASAADHPFMLQSPFNAQSPFTVTLPTKTDDGKAAQTAVIKFISVDCEATAGAPSVGTAQFTAFFNGNSGNFRLPFAAGLSFPNATEFSLAQPTLIYADAGSTLNFGLSADSAPCSFVLTGNLLTKDK